MSDCGCGNEKHEILKQKMQNDGNYAETVKKASEIFAALSDSSRMKILLALSAGELCVYNICAVTGAKQSATSQHLRKLKDCNIIKSRKEGNMVLYSLADEHISSIVHTVIEHLSCK